MQSEVKLNRRSDEVFLLRLKTLVSNLFLHDPNYNSKYYYEKGVHSVIENAKEKAQYILDEIEALQHLVEVPVSEPYRYEYEVYIKPDENEPMPFEEGWYPIEKGAIRHQNKIEQYIANGVLRKIKTVIDGD